MKDLPRILSIDVVPPLGLRVRWQDGSVDEVDLTGVIADFAPFAPLADPATFARVRIAGYGSGVMWDNGLDYSADSLRRLAEEQRPWTSADLAGWQDEMMLSNQEAADLLGVGLSTFKAWRVGGRVPASAAIACRAMRSDRALFQAHYRPRKPGRPRASA